MEQNLSEKQRKRRLIIGVVFELIALTAILKEDTTLAIIFGIGGLGFIFNYFTCFCGTKKAIKSLKTRLEN